MLSLHPGQWEGPGADCAGVCGLGDCTSVVTQGQFLACFCLWWTVWLSEAEMSLHSLGSLIKLRESVMAFGSSWGRVWPGP